MAGICKILLSWHCFSVRQRLMDNLETPGSPSPTEKTFGSPVLGYAVSTVRKPYCPVSVTCFTFKTNASTCSKFFSADQPWCCTLLSLFPSEYWILINCSYYLFLCRFCIYLEFISDFAKMRVPLPPSDKERLLHFLIPWEYVEVIFYFIFKERKYLFNWINSLDFFHF